MMVCGCSTGRSVNPTSPRVRSDTVDHQLQSAYQSLERGEFAAAASICRSILATNPSQASALQVLGIAQRRLGRLDEAEALMRRSIEIASANPEFRSNLGQLLAARGKLEQGIGELERALALDPRFRPAKIALAHLANQTGDHLSAERHARELIEADASDAQAWSALGASHYGTGRYLEARSALQRAVALAPNYGPARYNLAATLCEEEYAEEALAEVDSAVRLGVDHRGLRVTRARALMQLDRFDEAEAVLAQLVTVVPNDLSAQFLLSQLRHVRGDADFARSIREAAGRADAPLAVRMSYADTLRRAGTSDAAERQLRELIAQYGPRPELLGSLGTILQDAGRYAEAVTLTRAAAEAQRDDSAAAENMVAALLAAGEPGDALSTIERFRIASPRDQRWITYRADVARQRGESLFDEWCDVDGLVRVYDLRPPPGYATIEQFHAALRPILESRHRQRLHPLDQSLRFGTQTSRGLLTASDPVIRSFLAALAEPLAAYQAEIGQDAMHPLRARNVAPAGVTGCWSVRLRRGGFHVNHIHPQGWISSAYYVTLPSEVEDAAQRSGWLKFGEPLHPMPQGTARRFVQPREGRLVLFPSYFWHGTTPIHGDEPRLTIAFDAVPQQARQDEADAAVP
jgi:uncharacterized protein (TIGR02466 family)